MGSNEQAVLRTLIYSDIFDFPLQQAELWRYLFTQQAMSYVSFLQALQHLMPKYVLKVRNFYCLVGRAELIQLRWQRAKFSRQKLKTAQKIAKIIALLPSVLLIGLSGSLAMNNADSQDDIDFFIITKANTLWLSRCLILVMLQILNKRRRRQQNKANNKICLNMLIDETNLSLQESAKDLYSSHEVIQMKPLIIKQDIYRQFLSANNWIMNFLPNTLAAKKLNSSFIHTNSKQSWSSKLLCYCESLARHAQIYYMRQHLGKEKVAAHFIAFHPKNYRGFVLQKFKAKSKVYAV